MGLEMDPFEDALPSSSTGGAGDGGFFAKERQRLIGDISKGVESILTNSNALNRKIEESISVGKEFHPISELWSKFERIMTASGIPNLYPQAPSSTTPTSEVGEDGAQGGFEGGRKSRGATGEGVGEQGEGEGGIRFETKENSLPPGVAPGGGRIYN